MPYKVAYNNKVWYNVEKMIANFCSSGQCSYQLRIGDVVLLFQRKLEQAISTAQIGFGE